MEKKFRKSVSLLKHLKKEEKRKRQSMAMDPENKENYGAMREKVSIITPESRRPMF